MLAQRRRVEPAIGTDRRDAHVGVAALDEFPGRVEQPPGRRGQRLLPCNGMDSVRVSAGTAVVAGRRWTPGGRPGPASWDARHPVRDEAGLTDMVLLGWSGFLPTARGAAASMLPGARTRVKGRGVA
ncbi:hypothetical protein GCM10027605_40360 [Micromonospora zhanjiangensis]